jgi:hypothetical protein
VSFKNKHLQLSVAKEIDYGNVHQINVSRHLKEFMFPYGNNPDQTNMMSTQSTSQWQPTTTMQNTLYPMTQPVQVMQSTFQSTSQAEHNFPPLGQSKPIHGTHSIKQNNIRQTQRMSSSSEEERSSIPSNNWQKCQKKKDLQEQTCSLHKHSRNKQ